MATIIQNAGKTMNEWIQQACVAETNSATVALGSGHRRACIMIAGVSAANAGREFNAWHEKSRLEAWRHFGSLSCKGNVAIQHIQSSLLESQRCVLEYPITKNIKRHANPYCDLESLKQQVLCLQNMVLYV